MKVCHMTSAHSSDDVRIFYKECSSLASNGYEVYEVAPGESYDRNGVHIIGVGAAPQSRKKRMLVFSRKVYKEAFKLNCDVYHIHDPELLPYGLKLKKKGKKVIFDSHENTVEQIKEKEWIPSLVRVPLYYVFDFYQRYACRHFDSIISVTPHICDYFQRINKNTYMVTNYPILKPKTDFGDRIVGRLCFAGGISPQWNHEAIIQAIHEIDNCEYVLCGSGEGSYFETLKHLPGWSKVYFKGKLPHSEVNSVLSSSQIGLSLLSYNHNTAFELGTLGNTKIFEEMMAGIPVVCTDFSLWKEFVNKYRCGICVKPKSITEIKNAIIYLMENPEIAKEMGERGRLAVEEEFNWKSQEKSLLNVYQNL